MKSEGVVPEIVNEGKYYDVGSVKLGNKIYDVKFISEKNTDEYYEGEFIEEKLVFFEKRWYDYSVKYCQGGESFAEYQVCKEACVGF